MNFKVMTALVLGLALTAGGAYAKDKEKKKDKSANKWEAQFNAMDTNHDGQISKDEFKAYAESKHAKKEEKEKKKDA